MLLVAASFALAAAVGLLRNVVIARQFGIGAELDAYYAAFKLPDLLFTIVAGGALATAFIPVFADFLAADDRDGAWRLASAITNWVVLITGGLARAGWPLLAPWLVRVVIAPGFDAAQQAETVAVMRLVLISTVIFGISAVQGSVLHGFKHFLLPALAPVVYPLGIIVGRAVAGAHAGACAAWPSARSSARVLHLAIKIPGLIHYGFRWWPVLRRADTAACRRVAVLMGPRVLDLGVFHLTLLATTNLASRLGAGSVSALEWGWDAMQLPETIIGTAFGLVAFPTLAELAARGDRDGLRAHAGRVAAHGADPGRPGRRRADPAGSAAAGAALSARRVRRGRRPRRCTSRCASMRWAWSAHSCLELAARTFFAQQDTVTPLFAGRRVGGRQHRARRRC